MRPEIRRGFREQAEGQPKAGLCGAKPATRAASGPALGALRPLCEVLAEARMTPGHASAARSRGIAQKAMLRAAAECREASALRQGAPRLARVDGWLRLAALRSPSLLH